MPDPPGDAKAGPGLAPAVPWRAYGDAFIIFAMPAELIIELSAFALLVIAAIAAWRMPVKMSRSAYRLAFAALCASIAGLIVALRTNGWDANLGFTLRISAAATLLAYIAIGLGSIRVRQLGVLLMPYLLILSLLALVIGLLTPPQSASPVGPIVWYDAHIVFALATYALLTLAALAGLSCLLQEAALKRKSTGGAAARLPSVNDAEQGEIRLLAAAEIVLGIGIATGMAVAWFKAQDPLPFDHKSVLAIAAFVLIGALLIARARSGYRGKRAARLVMMAWLLLTLAYPGVKFVREFLLS